MKPDYVHLARLSLAIAAAAAFAGPAAAAPDEGKRACVADARRLCVAEMNSMRRSRVEACLITHIAETSPLCHATMLKIKAQRDAAIKPRSA